GEECQRGARRISASAAGQLGSADAVVPTHGLDNLLQLDSLQDPLLPAQVSRGTALDHDPEPIHESVATEDPVVPRLRPWGLGRLTDPRLHEAPVRRLRVGAAELTGPGGKQLLVSDPVEAAPAEGVSRVARPRPLLRPRNHSSPHGIEVNVAGEDPEIGLVLDQFRPIASLEEMPAEPMTASPPVGIGR